MNLFVAWRDSLTIFKPKNFELFLLVTLKSMVDTLKVWIKYFWWLPVLWAIQTYIQFYLASATASNASPALISGVHWLSTLPNGVYLLIPSLNFLFKITLLLAARPSTALKNCAYFRYYAWRIFIAAICYNVIQTAFAAAGAAFMGCYNLTLEDYTWMMFKGLIVGTAGLLLSFYFITYVLFFFDGDGSLRSFIKSWIYAAKMILYNLPFYAIYTLVNGLLLLSIVAIYSYSSQSWVGVIMVVSSIFFSLVEVFSLCLLTNFYVKKLHDQFTLYFGKNA